MFCWHHTWTDIMIRQYSVYSHRWIWFLLWVEIISTKPWRDKITSNENTHAHNNKQRLQKNSFTNYRKKEAEKMNRTPFFATITLLQYIFTSCVFTQQVTVSFNGKFTRNCAIPFQTALVLVKTFMWKEYILALCHWK